MANMKTNHTYIVAGFVIVILGVIFWSGGSKPEVVEETENTATTTQTTTETNKNKPAGITVVAKKPAPEPTPTVKPEAIPSIPTESDLNGEIFRMISYNGTEVSSDVKYLLSFKDESLSINFCNTINGRYLLDSNSIKADNLLSTKMYCSSPTGIMEMESAFISMLNYGAIIYKSDNKIILSYAKGTVMVFEGF